MIYKKIKLSTLPLEHIMQSLDLNDADRVISLVEDLSVAISLLGDIDCPAGVITAVADAQKLLIGISRLDNDSNK